ncbi:hypothetical protein GGI12_002224 [Dipsacomyces acuminosporus]|nr:hypothetical protein GGI12_002224 [Dipsacomyces acuminosporus]
MSSSNIIAATGASCGIGKAITLRPIKQCVSAVGVACSAAALSAVNQEVDATAGASSARLILVVGDVTDPEIAAYVQWMSSNNVIIVTGASRGIGKAIALHLIKQGVSVVGVARSADALNSVSQEVSEISGTSFAKFVPVAGDVTDDSVQQSAVDQATKLGTLVALVNNAAVVEPIGTISSIDFDEWARHFQTNVIAPFKLIQKVIPSLRSVKGRIINVSSEGSKTPFPSYAVYGAGKAAINYATATLAVEEPDITSVSIHPGVVVTPMFDKVVSHVSRSDYSDSQKAAELIGRSIKTDLPGAIIGNLALRADHSLSGKYVKYNDPEMAEYSQ